MLPTYRLITITSAALLVIAAVDTANAFDTDQRKCRVAIAKNTVKLATIISKTLIKCHKDRSKNGTAVDCSTVSPQSDPNSKVAAAETKLAAQVGGSHDRCVGVAGPAAVGFASCAAPCDSAVPSVTTFADVAACLVCLAEDSTEDLSANTQGSPAVPLLTADAKCHGTLGKQSGKLYKTVLKELSRCQKEAEKNGAEDTSSCEGSDPNGKIGATESKVSDKISVLCANATLENLDSCSDVDVASLVACLQAGAQMRSNALFITMFGGSTATTTTTTTTLPPQDALCPDRALLVAHAGISETSCASNGDCSVGGCDDAVGRCLTTSEEDVGWVGLWHDEDTNEEAPVGLALRCPGPASPGCGSCLVTGLDSSAGNCRCQNDNTIPCDEPLVADLADCGGATCQCYLSPPEPWSAGLLPLCTVRRLDQKPGGTINVDTGDASVELSVRRVTYYGIDNYTPCPTCGGTCTDPVDGRCTAPTNTRGDTCNANADCDDPPSSGNGSCRFTFGDSCATDYHCDVNVGDGLGVCGNFDPVANDDVRGGTCYQGENAGQPCDAQVRNSHFPAGPGANGGDYSLDCMPSTGKNNSGAGLKTAYTATTGSVSLSRSVDCGVPYSFPGLFQNDCFCRVCSGDASVACSSDAECASIGAGTCSSNGSAGSSPGPNGCDPLVANGGDGVVGLCVDVGGGEGECASSADDLSYCDGVLLADGRGFRICDPTLRCLGTVDSCTTNAECVGNGEICTGDGDCSASAGGIDAGSCSLVQRRSCFLDPIAATGAAGTAQSTWVATYCMGPTSNAGVNAVAGLPGPVRVRQENTWQAYCASSPAVVYTPGVSNCP